MTCPSCKKNLQEAIFYSTAVDYCPDCLGIWFDEGELNESKDNKDRNLRWLDIDLWKHPEKFTVSRGKKLCPSCRLPLYETSYGDSNIRVDVCNLCKGVWLDKGEYRKIIEWLKEEAQYKVMQKYAKSVIEESKEIFVGPENLREEIADFISILKLLKYKLLVQAPVLMELISSLPK